MSELDEQTGFQGTRRGVSPDSLTFLTLPQHQERMIKPPRHKVSLARLFLEIPSGVFLRGRVGEGGT